LSRDYNLRASLGGLRTLEIGDQSGDYAALLLSGLGAEVIKIEPRGGASSRRIGPFADGNSDPEQSLFFWRYNLNKQSVTLEVDHLDAQPALCALAARADLVLLSGEYEVVARRLPLWRKLAQDNPRLIVCTITPFGLDGPWRAAGSWPCAATTRTGKDFTTLHRLRPPCGIPIIWAANTRRLQ
jgi:crotonobetainyl-CoA:carnitine CoA-transferase CaiB-like acyl-CoA transferase